MAEQPSLEQHRATWNGFIKLTAVSTALALAVLALMAIFLT